MTVEALAYADLARLIPFSQNRVMADKLGYVLLEVIGRSIFEFSAYTVVTVMWFKTAIQARFGNRDEVNIVLKCLPRALFWWAVLLICASLIQATDILLHQASDADGQHHGSAWALRSHLLIEGLAWGFHGCLAILCVAMTAKRIVQLSTWSQSGNLTRLRIMTKSLLPMTLCSLCYATRSICLVLQVSAMPSTPTHSARRSHPAWWIVFVWIPTVVPSVMLLYSARKRDPMSMRTTMGDDANLSPLLPTPVPPAEAFISFQRFTEHNGDLLSPFTPLRMGYDDDDTFDMETLEKGSFLQSEDDSTCLNDS